VGPPGSPGLPGRNGEPGPQGEPGLSLPGDLGDPGMYESVALIALSLLLLFLSGVMTCGNVRGRHRESKRGRQTFVITLRNMDRFSKFFLVGSEGHRLRS